MRNAFNVVGFSILCMVFALAARSEPAAPQKPSQLFQETHVWNVHLHFTPDQWDEMEPKNGPGRGGFRPGGGGGPGGPSMLIAPMFLKDGDVNHDGKLSKDEFHALGGQWFTRWDARKTDKLTVDQLREGIEPMIGAAFARGPGMRLQGPEGQRNGLAAANGIEFKYVHADLEFEGQTIKDVGVRFKGNGTWMQSQGQLKRSMKVDLNHFAKGQKLAGVTKLNFHSNVTDASWMNEVLSHRLYRDAGVPAPRTAYARVYLTVPGKHEHKYVGLYSIVEDVDKNFAREILASKDGAIFKPVTPNLFGDLGDNWARYKQTYDPKTELTEQQSKRVIAFANLVTHADDAEFAAKLPEYVDLDETARFMAVTVWLTTLDSILGMGQNFYVYLDPTNRFQFLPWDLDHSFGQFGMQGTQEQREGLSINHPWRGDNRFLERLFKVEAFKQIYLAKLDQFDKTIFQPQRFYQQVDAIAAAIRPAVSDESPAMLARFDKVVAGETVEPAARFGGRGGFMQGAKPIKGFVDGRAKSVIDQVAGKSEGQMIPGGFGGGGGRGGMGGGGGAGPGMMVAMLFMNGLDANKDGQLTRDEVSQGFDKWFVAWNSDGSGLMSEEQLRTGIDKDLSPSPGGGGGFLRGLFGGPRRGQ
jgi:spore coat protein CotH